MFSVTTLKHDAALDIEFVLIASQFTFDNLGLERVKDRVWSIINEQRRLYISGMVDEDEVLTLHQVCGKVAEELMKDAIRLKNGGGNISVIMIAFK